MKTYYFRAEALTPVHVGAGQEIDPCEYALKDGRLMRFNPAAVLNDLDENERRHFETVLLKTDLKEIQSFLNHRLVPERHALSWVDASREFIEEYAEKINNPDNAFKVQMMPRNPHSGKVYMPGSSIKGAIRTAVINYFTNDVQDQQEKDVIHNAVKQAEPKYKSSVLEQKALKRAKSIGGKEKDQIDRDVFRLIKIEDSALSSGSTVINKAHNWNPSKPDIKGIPMWFERLKCRAENAEITFQVCIQIDTGAMNHEYVKPHLGRILDMKTIGKACNDFYWKRLQKECEKFYPEDNDPVRQAVYRTLVEPGKHIFHEPNYPPRILLRLGRFSHFESLSVDNLREGYNIRTHETMKDMGNTRTRCHLDNNLPPLPFGWLLLTRQK